MIKVHHVLSKFVNKDRIPVNLLIGFFIKRLLEQEDNKPVDKHESFIYFTVFTNVLLWT